MSPPTAPLYFYWWFHSIQLKVVFCFQVNCSTVMDMEVRGSRTCQFIRTSSEEVFFSLQFLGLYCAIYGADADNNIKWCASLYSIYSRAVVQCIGAGNTEHCDMKLSGIGSFLYLGGEHCEDWYVCWEFISFPITFGVWHVMGIFLLVFY